MKERILGLPRNIFFLGLTSLFNDFSSEMVYSVFPAFFTSVLKVGAGSLGLVDGVAEAVSNLFKIYSGNLSDRFQKRKALVVFGYVLSVLTRPLYVWVSSVGGALGLRVLDRVGKGLRDAPRDAIISLSTPREETGRSFGYHRAMDTIGGILGPLVAYLILRAFPLRFDLIFLTAFGVGIIAIVSLVFIRDVVVATSPRKGSLAGSFGRFSARFKIYLLAAFVLSIGTLPVSVLLLKTESIGLVIADIPLFYMVYSVSYAAFSVPAGKLSDRIGARVVLFIGYVLLVVAYFNLNAAHSSGFLAFAFFMLGLFPALTDGVARAFAAQLTTEDLRGSGLGWLNAVNGIGALAAGALGGYVWQTYGPTTAFVAESAVIAIGLVVLCLLPQPSVS